MGQAATFASVIVDARMFQLATVKKHYSADLTRRMKQVFQIPNWETSFPIVTIFAY